MKIPFLKTSGKYSVLDTLNPTSKHHGEYEYLDFFQEGFAKAKFRNKWCYIDEGGHHLNLNFQYDEIEQFQDGIAAVKREKLWRFINKNGIEITQRGYDSYCRLINGFINVSIAGEYGYDMEQFYHGDKENAAFISKYYSGLIDYTGFEIVPPSSGIPLVQDDFILISNEHYYEAVRFNGEQIFSTTKYSSISSFYKNRAIAIEKKQNEVFIIDNHLNQLKSLGIRERNELGETYMIDNKQVDGFLNGLYPIRKNNKWGFINTNGEELCEFKYDKLEGFLNKDFTIAGKLIEGKMKFAILDNNLKEVTTFKYDNMYSFPDGAAVEINEKWGFINSGGKEILPTHFSKIKDVTNGFISVSLGDYQHEEYFGKYGFHKLNGKKVCPIIYDWVGDFSSGFAEIRLNEKYGLINEEGKEVTNIKYDNILNHSSSFYFVEKSGRRFVINENGKEFCEYPNK